MARVQSARQASAGALAAPDRGRTSFDGASPSPAEASVIDRKPRYEVEVLVGSGAQGHVYRAFDRDLSRFVAMKVLRSELASDPERVAQFFAEARRTGALEHACIPAVYEVGHMASGEPFFTMRFIEGRTLFDVLDALRHGDREAAETWSVTKLAQLVLRIAHTAEYAHSHGLIHRDLKPSNVALAAHDEVLVLDWGLSKRVETRAKPRRMRSVHLDATVAGEVKGTPLYMAPEQACGEVDRLERRTDVFALGALLYECLCLQPPYEGTTVPEVVRNARNHRITPPSVRNPDREIPKALEETAMKALSRSPEDRHATAAAFADDIQRWLDGSRDRGARQREAASLTHVAIELVKKAQEFRAEAGAASAEASAYLAKAEPWWPTDRKAKAWDLEDLAVQRRGMAEQAEARAVELASSALAHEPGQPTARELLARIYMRMYLDAVEREDVGQAAWLRRMVRIYDDGTVGASLRDDGRLSVAAEQDDAHVTLHRMEERGRRLVPVSTVSTQPSPALWEAIPHGLYTARITAAGCIPASVPIRVRPGSGKGLVVRLLPKADLPDGFVYVPAGAFSVGPKRARQEVTLPAFLIQRSPVLLRDYALWLDDLWSREPDEAQIHVPWTPTHGPLLHQSGSGFVFCPAGPLAEHPVEEHEDLPVVGIARSSAVQYARWWSLRHGLTARLPTEMQWEKAARGTDGREYPWGSRFDPTFCSMFHSTKERARLRPVGAFAADESPYGAIDMAGNVHEWCRDETPDEREGVARGGAWNCRAADCRVTSRWMLDPQTRTGTLGFRMCIEIRRDKEETP
ncbi:MAG: Serine/threonine-protein kinase PknD [Planctomycetes bacterium]|nr:Serine/threonine-protein kinase PknD [Planctomycetota bacterium]